LLKKNKKNASKLDVKFESLNFWKFGSAPQEIQNSLRDESSVYMMPVFVRLKRG